LLSAQEIAKLQDQAIAARDYGRVLTLEKVRQSLATERKEPARTDEEVARLEGQLLHACVEQATRQERADQFQRTRHQSRWEINGEKYSLADLDRRIADQEQRSQFFGTPLKIKTIHLLPSGRREAAAEAERLKEIHETVVDKIDARRTELAEATREAGKMTAVLSEIYGQEQQRQHERGGERIDKRLIRGEINQLIERATVVSDGSMLHQAYILEAQFEERQPKDKSTPFMTQAARAIGRQVMSELAVKQAQERLQTFEDRKQFTPVVVKDLEGRDVAARLFDFRNSRHPVVWAAERATESKEHRHLRHEVEKAATAEHDRLKDDLQSTIECHEITRGIADSYRDHVRASGDRVPDAAFTPKQLIQLEVHAARLQDPQERQRIETLVKRAELAGHVYTPQTYEMERPGAPAQHRNSYQEKAEHSGQPRPRLETKAQEPRQSESTRPSLGQSPQLDRQQPAAPNLTAAATVKEAHDLDLLH
jgi:hypothetical protein